VEGVGREVGNIFNWVTEREEGKRIDNCVGNRIELSDGIGECVGNGREVGDEIGRIKGSGTGKEAGNIFDWFTGRKVGNCVGSDIWVSSSFTGDSVGGSLCDTLGIPT
jgi:hypothetical protein